MSDIFFPLIRACQAPRGGGGGLTLFGLVRRFTVLPARTIPARARAATRDMAISPAPVVSGNLGMLSDTAVYPSDPQLPKESHRHSFPYFLLFFIHRSFYQRIVRRGAGRNSWERVYPRTAVQPQFLEAQPPLSRPRNTGTE